MNTHAPKTTAARGSATETAESANRFSTPRRRLQGVSASASLDVVGNTSTPPVRPGLGRLPGSSPQIGPGVHSRNSSFGGDLGSALRGSPGVPEHVPMQNRLVEQFYKMDAKSTPRVSAFGGLAFGGPLAEPLAADSPRGPSHARSASRAPGTATFGSAFEKRIDAPGEGLKVHFTRFDDGIMDPDACADTLLSIDTQKADFELGRVASVLTQAILEAQRPLRLGDALPSGQQQLGDLEQHLRSVRTQVDEITAELDKNIAGAKTVYHEQTQRSMAKVAQLRELLGGLSARVEAAKIRMADSRRVLETRIADRIAVLEQVSARFEAHDLMVRQRRMRYLVAVLAAVALVLAAYMVVGGRP